MKINYLYRDYARCFDFAGQRLCASRHADCATSHRSARGDNGPGNASSRRDRYQRRQ